MDVKMKYLIFSVFLISFGKVESASWIERSYDYFMSLGKSLAPNFLTILDCFGGDDPWVCSREKAAKMLDEWEKENNEHRRSWKDAADAEVVSSGRSHTELPSALGTEVESSLQSLADVVQQGIATTTSRKKHHEGGGIDTITISTGADKKKEKKKKQKPAKIHLIHAPMMRQDDPKGRNFHQNGKTPIQSWVIGTEENKDEKNILEDGVAKSVEVRKARGILDEAWAMGEKALDAVAEHVVENENAENGFENDKSSIEEQRGKKKKKKKAILKLLILGAVLKAKIGSLLQILSFKLQVKFFLIALIGLGINLARFWLDLKKSHQQPQKVVYYEHASHQHHYDHEDEHGWGPWSRSMDPEEESESDVTVQNVPYRAYDKNTQVYTRPLTQL